jgi:hypothetical protein
MSEIHDDERREVYREAPPPDAEPQLIIITKDERAIPDNVADINARGAKVEFDSADAPSLVPGKGITVGVEAPGLSGSVEIDARTVFAATRGERFVSAIAFAKLPEAISNAGGAFFTIFNRRSARRPFTDSEQSALSATVLTELESSKGHPVKIVNYSKTGIGIMATGAVSELLKAVDIVELMVSSNRTAEIRKFTAHVVHRASRGSDNYFGCLLVPKQ